MATRRRPVVGRFVPMRHMAVFRRTLVAHQHDASVIVHHPPVAESVAVATVFLLTGQPVMRMLALVMRMQDPMVRSFGPMARVLRPAVFAHVDPPMLRRPPGHRRKGRRATGDGLHVRRRCGRDSGACRSVGWRSSRDCGLALLCRGRRLVSRRLRSDRRSKHRQCDRRAHEAHGLHDRFPPHLVRLHDSQRGQRGHPECARVQPSRCTARR